MLLSCGVLKERRVRAFLFLADRIVGAKTVEARKSVTIFGVNAQLREVTAKGGKHEIWEVADDKSEISGSIAVRRLWPQVTETPTRSGLNSESVLLSHITRCPEVGWLQDWLILCGSMTLSRNQMYLSFCSAIPGSSPSISGLCPHGHKMAARVPDIS